MGDPVTEYFQNKDWVKTINMDYIRNLYENTKIVDNKPLDNYNQYVFKIVEKILVKINEAINTDRTIIIPDYLKKILEVNYFNAGLELTHDYKEPILHIEFTINYSDENNNNMEIIEHIIHNTINNYSFIINTYDNYQFTITYNIKSFRLRQVSKTVETKISSIYIIPTININKSSSTECNFKFALHNFYKLALLNKDKEGITNEIKGVAGNFISDNIERVYTNYKQTNILKTTAKETEFKSKNELITQNTTPENNINITNAANLKIIEQYTLFRQIYTLPPYNHNNNESVKFYYMFTLLFSQAYISIPMTFLMNILYLYILRDNVHKSMNNFIPSDDIKNYQIYDKDNHLLIFKVILKINDNELMEQSIKKTGPTSCTIEITSIYNLKTDNLYVDTIIHRDDTGFYTLTIPTSNYFTKLFSEPVVFFIDTHQTQMGGVLSHTVTTTKQSSKSLATYRKTLKKHKRTA